MGRFSPGCANLRVMLLMGLVFPTICAGQTAQPITPAVIYDRSHASVVVVIIADRDSNPIGQGSGFIVTRNRVVTNHHVIKDAARALVVFADGTSEEAEGIAADSAARDLAILVVKTGSRSPLKLGDELAARQGDSVYALGAPRGLELSLTNGIVSGFRDLDDQFVLQTTAAIAPGSSGGPLFDCSGRVIGVTTSLLSDSPGIYFSVGARDVSRMLRSPGIIVPFTPTSRPTSKSAPRNTPTPQPPSSDAARSGLFVSSNPPGAEIFINGMKQPVQTPGSLALAPGQYDLVVRRSGYDAYAGRVQVKDNIQTTLDIELKERTQVHVAWAQVDSSPSGAEIFIDGTPANQTTPARVQIPAGSHIIAIRLAGYQIAKRGVQVSEGGTVNVTEVLHLK
jgi:hypothetical protein